MQGAPVNHATKLNNTNHQDIFHFRQYNFNASTVVDGGWHQVCVTWSGLSGAVNVYYDGRDLPLWNTNGRPSRGYLAGDGLLHVGGYFTSQLPDDYNVTEVHIWDRVLQASEIATFSQGCYKATGNIKEWNDFKPTIEPHADNYRVPSHCPVSKSPTNPPASANGVRRTQQRDARKKKKVPRKIKRSTSFK